MTKQVPLRVRCGIVAEGIGENRKILGIPLLIFYLSVLISNKIN